MSELVERLIGSYVEPVPPLHPLAALVERQLRVDPAVCQFLGSLPESPPASRLRVVTVNEREARCACPFSIKDHESASYLHSEVAFIVDLGSKSCSLLPF